MSPQKIRTEPIITPISRNVLYFLQHALRSTTVAVFSKDLAQSESKEQLLVMSFVFSLRVSKLSWFQNTFLTPFSISSLNDLTSSCAYRTLSIRGSLYFSHRVPNQLCDLFIVRSISPYLLFSLINCQTLLISPKARRSGQSQVTQTAQSKSCSPLVSNQAPQSQLSLYLDPIFALRTLALEATNLVSEEIFCLKAELRYWQRRLEEEQLTTMSEARAIGIEFEINMEKRLTLYNNKIFAVSEDMEMREGNNKRDQGSKMLRFLSEHESQSSEMRNNKLRNANSAKIMRKLKQLWNRQRFLTDDEGQSSIDPGGSAYMSDSSLNFQVEERMQPPQNKKQPKKHSQYKKTASAIKPLHRRQASSEEERLSMPQKMKKRGEQREYSNNQAEGPSINAQLSEIEAFNSAIQDFSSS